MPMALKVIGKDSMASLSVEENMGFHCRSILTQMMINGQSRAEKKTMIDTDTQFRAKVIASCAEIEQPWRRSTRRSKRCIGTEERLLDLLQRWDAWLGSRLRRRDEHWV